MVGNCALTMARSGPLSTRGASPRLAAMHYMSGESRTLDELVHLTANLADLIEMFGADGPVSPVRMARVGALHRDLFGTLTRKRAGYLSTPRSERVDALLDEQGEALYAPSALRVLEGLRHRPGEDVDVYSMLSAEQYVALVRTDTPEGSKLFIGELHIEKPHISLAATTNPIQRVQGAAALDAIAASFWQCFHRGIS